MQLKNDKLNLQIPIHITDMAFVPETEDKVLAACTAHYQIRMYDVREGARPRYNVEIGEHPLTCLAVTNDGSYA